MTNGDDLTREVNRLYWDTDTPVTRLAEQLGVSRGTFYNHTQPLPAGAACARCGGTMAYANRQARDSAEAQCLECGHEKRLSASAAARLETPPAGASGAGRKPDRPDGSTGAAPPGAPADEPAEVRARRERPGRKVAESTRSLDRARALAASAEPRDLALLFTAISVGIGAVAAGVMLLGRRS